jgi:hypothetical protein
MTFSNDCFNAIQCLEIRDGADHEMSRPPLEGMPDDGELAVVDVTPGVKTTGFTWPLAHRIASGADLELFPQAVPVSQLDEAGDTNVYSSYSVLLQRAVGTSGVARKRARKPRLDLERSLIDVQRMKLICGPKVSRAIEREDVPGPTRLGAAPRSAAQWAQQEAVDWTGGQVARSENAEPYSAS